ncbi:hypothetical protein Y032_0045g1294 [Ancylostoma ceylanicum]|uniref:Uncharacterized protein n=1 Tax=Ancylostoma ceylanicum TaxID=53326 RepID=A0A016UEW8_9BILA|nr:hypothetical protein Y032_0045g1294 [Ancylostoma ceylanicum]
MTSSTVSSCPDCQSRTVHWRNTLSGLLCGILCFPCGIYCCLRRRQQHCSKCDCDVIKSTRLPVNTFGYAFRGYQSIDKGIPASMAVAYRNTAYSASTGVSTRGNTGSSTNSQTELIHNRTNN